VRAALFGEGAALDRSTAFPGSVPRSALLRISADQIAGLLMVLIVVVMAILLSVQQLMRLALVDVLLILAPLGGLLWVLPQTQAWARLRGRLFVGTVFAQTVLVLTLRLGFNLATVAVSFRSGGSASQNRAHSVDGWPARTTTTPCSGPLVGTPRVERANRRQALLADPDTAPRHQQERPRDNARFGARAGEIGAQAGRVLSRVRQPRCWWRRSISSLRPSAVCVKVFCQ
jgi:hypothetical protein